MAAPVFIRPELTPQTVPAAFCALLEQQCPSLADSLPQGFRW